MAKFDFQKYFGEIAPLADAARENEQRPWTMAVPRDPEHHDLVLYLGCNVLRTVNLAESVVEILRYLGVDFTAVGGPANCCGIIHENNGAGETGDKLRRHSLGKLAAFTPSQVLTFCPSCQLRMDQAGPQREALGVPYRPLSEYLAENLGRMKFVHRIERRVALHAHTSTLQQDQDREVTRTLLEAIPGLEVTVLPPPRELGRMCTPAVAAALGEARYREIVGGMFETARGQGLDAMVTAYHGCYRSFCDWEAGHGLEVIHYATLLCQALGLRRYRDTYKSLRQEGNPAAAFQALRPAAERRGVNMERLRKSTETHFARAGQPAKGG
ncbi:MAG: heterodisulfide reductase-related iron-sulfur binding cluster [SAR324 cluster bacterium]|nr:heterodisulfide reductase-related iron-sulfur binding cluster [SAR324 cluster bacterium]